LHRAEVIYAATSSGNFTKAELEFLRRFPRQTATEDMLFGVDHFLHSQSSPTDQADFDDDLHLPQVPSKFLRKR